MRAANNYFLGNPEYIENAAFTELNIEEIPDFVGKCTMVGNDVGAFENTLGEL